MPLLGARAPEPVHQLGQILNDYDPGGRTPPYHDERLAIPRDVIVRMRCGAKNFLETEERFLGDDFESRSGPDLHRGQLDPVLAETTVEQFLPIGSPDRLGSSALRDLDDIALARQRPHVDLLDTRLVRSESEPSAIG